jgi:hypothetical protein
MTQRKPMRIGGIDVAVTFNGQAACAPSEVLVKLAGMSLSGCFLLSG